MFSASYRHAPQWPRPECYSPSSAGGHRPVSAAKKRAETAIQILNDLVSETTEVARAAQASIQGATVRVSPEVESCPRCEARLQVYKTQVRSVISLTYGSFQAHEVLRQCPQGCQWLDGDRETHIRRSPFLAQLVAPHPSYSFEVLAKVGILLSRQNSFGSEGDESPVDGNRLEEAGIRFLLVS